MKSLELQIKEKTAELENLKTQLAKQNETKRPNYETCTNEQDIYNVIGCDPKKDVVNIDKFTREQTQVVLGIIFRIRACEVLNEGELPKPEARWYPWFLRKNRNGTAGSGLVFNNSRYDVDGADVSSASRLSFKDANRSNAYGRNFIQNEEKIIQL